jgi:hypothetical protein
MKKWFIAAALVFSSACAGQQKSCATFNAGSFGADWIVVQFDMSGKIFHCWKLEGVVVENESSGDGISWLNSRGHIVHIGGWYNRVQVGGKDFAGVLAQEYHMTLDQCEGR